MTKKKDKPTTTAGPGKGNESLGVPSNETPHSPLVEFGWDPSPTDYFLSDAVRAVVEQLREVDHKEVLDYLAAESICHEDGSGVAAFANTCMRLRLSPGTELILRKDTDGKLTQVCKGAVLLKWVQTSGLLCGMNAEVTSRRRPCKESGRVIEKEDWVVEPCATVSLERKRADGTYPEHWFNHELFITAAGSYNPADSFWSVMPELRLIQVCMSQALRFLFADILSDLPYAIEELPSVNVARVDSSGAQVASVGAAPESIPAKAKKARKKKEPAPVNTVTGNAPPSTNASRKKEFEGSQLNTPEVKAAERILGDPTSLRGKYPFHASTDGTGWTTIQYEKVIVMLARDILPGEFRQHLISLLSEQIVPAVTADEVIEYGSWVTSLIDPWIADAKGHRLDMRAFAGSVSILNHQQLLSLSKVAVGDAVNSIIGGR